MMISDNGLTFKSAAKEIQEIVQSSMLLSICLD